MGRPRWEDEDLVARLCKRLESGQSYASAGTCEGLGRGTLTEWRNRADRPNPAPALVLALNRLSRARARAVVRAEQRLYGGDLGPLRWLERMEPALWGRNA